MSQLRKLLGRETIVTRGRGYALIAADGALDLQRFEQRAAGGTAEHAAGRPEAAAAELRAALAVWRGPALSDLADVPAVRPIAVRLDELRLAALERRIGADLECGNAAEAAAELDPLIAEHPLRERLRALQMRALYRCGRQADALAVYRAARETLVDELGLEPGAELQELERAILRRDPSLAAADGTRSPPAAPTVLCAALATTSPAPLAELGAPLAAGRGGELVLAATVPSSDRLGPVTSELHALGAALSRRGVIVRAAAFTSVTPGNDLGRLAAEQDADLLLADAPAGLLEDARLIALLEHAPCDVAVVVGGRQRRARAGAGPVLGRRARLGGGRARRVAGALARTAAAPGRREHRRVRARRQPAARQRLPRAAARAGRSGRAGDRRPGARSARRGGRAMPAWSPSGSPSAGGATGSGAPGRRSRRMPPCPRCSCGAACVRGASPARAGDTRFTWTIATAVA